MKGHTTLEMALPMIERAFPGGIAVNSFRPMKAGMTNDSYFFSSDKGEYILRLPGKGSEALINRSQEYQAYQLLDGHGITDEVVYFEPQSGVRITRFIRDARVCSPDSEADIVQFLNKLKQFHDLRLEVDHFFDPWERLEYYESLFKDQGSRYPDYAPLKQTIYQLYRWTLEQPRDIILSHIDAVADNVLITPQGETYLIDWEYSAMQDKDIDIAMFAVYSLLTKPAVDRLIDLYQGDQPDPLQRQKIYAYIAIMGLVWSNWCEYQSLSGNDLGDYALGQYQFAKDYSAYFAACEGV